MGELTLLWKVRGRRLLNKLGRGSILGVVREHSVLKLAVIALFAVGFWCGLFFLFLDGFNFLGRMPELRSLVMGVLLALFFAALGLMLTISNGIIAFSSLFRSEESAFLFTTPLRPEPILLYKMGDGLVFSSWAFLFMGLPLVFAHGYSSGVPWYFYPWALVFFAVFVAIPASLGTAAALVIGRFFSHHPKRVLAALGATAAGAAGVWILRSYAAFHLGNKAYQVWMRDVLNRLTWSENPFLPSYWIAQGMLKAGQGEPREAAFYFLLLLSTALLALLIASEAGRRVFLSAYHNFHGITRRRKYTRHGAVRAVTGLFMFWLPAHLRAMVLKDITCFLRDPVQWSQALIFFGLIAVYVLNLRSLDYHLKRPEFKNMVAFLNLTATSLTLATFTSRFVFPLLSLEGRRFWILGLAPVRRRDILTGKFIFAFGACFVISSVLMVLSDLMLNVPVPILALHLFAVVAISAGVSGLSVGLGAVYRNLRDDNPSRIVSGFGGTLNLVLSMLLVGSVVMLLAVPCHMYLVRGMLSAGLFALLISGSLAAVAALGGIACCFPLALGRRALERMEV